MGADFSITDYLKTAVMRPLEERVAKLGVCPRCHKKTLRLYYTGADLDWFQCDQCLHVYMLPEQPKLIG